MGLIISDIEGRTEGYDKVEIYMFVVGSIIFMLLSICFIIAGIWLRKELRNIDEDVETTLKGKLICATLLLSVPFLIR